MTTEETTIQHMTDKRRDNFKVRFQKYYPRLCSMAAGYVMDRDDAEDIVQDLFISVWNKGKDTLPEGEFAAYMTTAVRNSCISFLRKKQEGTVSIEENRIAAEAIDDSDGYGDGEMTPEAHLHNALGTLPPKCKDIFLLAKLHGMKYKDIAAKLELSEKTVENQMTKAMKLLRAYAAQHRLAFVAAVAVILSVIINR